MRWVNVLVFLLGCGEVKANQPDGGGSGGGDGGTGDGSVDAPAVGEATVVVQLGGTVTVGVKVNFHEADGSLVGEGMTDSAGKAKATVHLGAMITVAVGPNDLVTITGVNPGEQVVLKTKPPYDRSSVGDVNFGTTTEATNKSYYRVDVGDDEYTTVQTMATGTRTITLLRSNLDGAGKFHIAAGTYNASNSLISYTFLTNQTPSMSGTTSVTLPAYRTDTLEFAVSLTSAPTGATNLSVDSFNEQTSMLFMSTAFANNANSNTTFSAGNASRNVVYPGGFGDAIRTNASVRFGTTRERMELMRRTARPAGAWNVGANDYPARIGSPAIDKTNVTRPVASWTVTGNTAIGDATLVDVGWSNGSGGNFNWHVFVAPEVTSVTFPVVSAGLAGQAPAQSSTGYNVVATQHALEPVAGWNAFRLAPPFDYSDTYGMPAGLTTWYFNTNYTQY